MNPIFSKTDEQKAKTATTPKPVVKGGPGKPDLYDPWDLHIVGLDDECREEAALYDPRVHDPIPMTFVDSVTADGILEMVEVVSQKDFRVVFGRKRTGAARIAGMPLAEGGRDKRVLVPVVFSPAGSTAAEVDGRVLTENAQRIDDNALVTADKAAAFLKRNGDTPDTRVIVCRNLGISPGKLNRLLKIRSADPQVVAAIKEGDLSLAQALKIITLPAVKQADVTTRVVAATRKAKADDRARKEAAKVAKAAKKAKGNKAEPEAPQSDEEIDDVAPARRGRRSSIAQVVAREVDLASGGEGFVAPTTFEVRELLETLRENPFLTEDVTADQILTYILGDGPNPFPV